jgi:hypothetical protein
LKHTRLAIEEHLGRHIQVVVSIKVNGSNQTMSIDPWGHCPSEIAREEGRYCGDCEFWGGEVEGIDWYEFSLCLYDDQ